MECKNFRYAFRDIADTDDNIHMEVEMIYHNLYITVLILLAIMLFPCLVRAVRGPGLRTVSYPST